MLTTVPFQNFTLRLSNLKLPIDINGWTSFFEEDFNNVSFDWKGKANIQMHMSDYYKIKFDAPILVEHINKFSSLPFYATLFNSSKGFYFLIYMGDDHFIASSVIKTLKGTSELFNSLGGGRFLSIRNQILMSFEEDESNKYYFLATSDQSLLDMDEIFNYSKKIMNTGNK